MSEDAPAPASPEAATPAPQSTEAELIAVRREKLAKLRELGVDPYGSRYEVTTTPGRGVLQFRTTRPTTSPTTRHGRADSRFLTRTGTAPLSWIVVHEVQLSIRSVLLLDLGRGELVRTFRQMADQCE